MNEKIWRTSSYSGNANNCVELALDGRSAGVRDTKNRVGGELAFGFAPFGAFLAAVKADTLGE
jgi:hypothetical protein